VFGRSKAWTAHWRDHLIQVTSRQTIFRSEESLSVDGVVVAHNSAWLPFGAYLKAVVAIDGKYHVITVELAPGRGGGSGNDCLIYADGTLIGGDQGASLVRDVYW
jgi:hypothetical protein